MLSTTLQLVYSSTRNAFTQESLFWIVEPSEQKVTSKLLFLTRLSRMVQARTQKRTTRFLTAPSRCSRKRLCTALNGQKTCLGASSESIPRTSTSFSRQLSLTSASATSQRSRILRKLSRLRNASPNTSLTASSSL